MTITALTPGPVETELFERADMLEWSAPPTSSPPCTAVVTKVGADDKDDPADVARDGSEALMAGKERVVSHSLSTEAQGRARRFMPDKAKAEMHRRMAEPGSAGKELEV